MRADHEVDMTLDTDFVNSKERSPAVYLTYKGEYHLFDCGRAQYPSRLLQKIRTIYVSHTHLDHFLYLDQIVDAKAHGTGSQLRVFGPEGITQAVRSKLQAYSWNLVEKDAVKILVAEITPTTIEHHQLTLPNDLKGESIGMETVDQDIMVRADDYKVKVIHLNHKITSLGYSFEENPSYNIDSEKLHASKLPAGPWIEQLKQQALHNISMPVDIDGKTYSFDQLQQMLMPKKGRKIVYLTDFLLDDLTLEKLGDFASKADVLYCEAAFAEKDLVLAQQKHHLTTKQAALIATAANAKELIPFHFSPRYEEGVLLGEVKSFFGNVR